MSAFAEEIVAALVRSSIQGTLFIGVVWLVCRLFPSLPASVRCGLWWAACLKLLIGLVWVSPVELPLLPAAERQPLPIEAVIAPSAPGGNVVEVAAASPAPSLKDGTLTALAALWLAGLLALTIKAARQLRHTRWVIRRSEPLNESWIRTAFAELCERLSLRRAPGLLGSEDVRTPQAIGLVRPQVVLPRAGLDQLSPPEVSMTLCHELLHLRRGDLWWGWVPALAHRVFFFHPLAAMAAREYAIAREAACDAEVIQILGSAPQAYGRLLLRWGVAPRETGLAAAGASPSLQNLKRRLQMLQQSTDNNSENRRRVSGWWWLAGVAVLAGLVPLRIVAQERAPEAGTPVEVAEAAEAPEPPMPGEPAEPAEPGDPVEPVEPGEPAPAPPAPPVESIREGVEGGVRGGVEGAIAQGVQGGVPGALAPRPPRPPRPPKAPRAAAPALPGTPAPKALPTPRPTSAVAPTPPVLPVEKHRSAQAPQALPAVGSTPRPAPVPPVAVASAIPAPTPVPRVHAAKGAKSVTPPPAPPAPPKAPKPPKPPKNKDGYSYSWSSDRDGDSWMLLTGNSSVIMSGDMDDLEKVKRLRGSSKEDILWFRHNGKAYVVRDAATLKRAKEIFKPQMELGAKQGELGAKQGELGGKQGELGAKQGALGAEMGALAAARARRGHDSDDSDLEQREREIQRKQEELSDLQAELGEKQAELGRRQAELGRQQEEASRQVERELKGLMERTIQSGMAEEVR